MNTYGLNHKHITNFAEVNDLNLAYIDEGEGPVIIFVPGWTFSAVVFEHQISELSKSHRTLAIDPRSHGRSDPTLGGNHYAQQARDLHGLLNALGIGKFTLVGWSAGAACCLEFCKQFGTDAVEKFVCIDQSPKPYSNDAEEWCIGNHDGWKGLYEPTINNRYEGTRGFCDWLATRKLSTDELEWLIGQSMATHASAASNLLIDLMFRDDIEVLKSVGDTLPVLNVVRDDQGRLAAEFIKKNGIKTSMEVFGAHMMFWEEHAKFNEVIKQFLAS